MFLNLPVLYFLICFFTSWKFKIVKIKMTGLLPDTVLKIVAEENSEPDGSSLPTPGRR